MLPKNPVAVVAGLLLVTALTACNLARPSQATPDVNALYTAAAGTLISQFNAQQTQTAAAATPTSAASPTPLASFAPLPTLPLGVTPFGTFTFSTPGVGLTPLPTLLPQGTGVYSYRVGCNDAQFIGGSPDDGKKIAALTPFKASWSMLNVGTCTWDEGYSFSFKSGDQMQGSDIKIITQDQFTAPGHSQAFVAHLITPKQTGEYKGFWQMKDDKGVWFGSLVWVDIVVQ